MEYLQAHPEAADNLEGIASWWLAGSGLRLSMEDVQEALTQLVATHRIALIDLADGRTLYQSVDKISGAHPAWSPPEPGRKP